MKRISAIITFFYLISSGQNALSQTEKNREGLGLRVGYVRTTSKLDDSFGPGLSLVLHFTETFRPPLAVDFSLGSFYLGTTSRDDITQSIFIATSYRAKMNITFFTVAPMIEFQAPGKTSFYVSAGLGLYSVMLLLDSGFFAAEDTQYHFGWNTGAGLHYKLTPSLRFDFNLAAHRFWTSNDRDDWFYVYSEGDRNPYFYQASIGLILYLK